MLAQPMRAAHMHHDQACGRAIGVSGVGGRVGCVKADLLHVVLEVPLHVLAELIGEAPPVSEECSLALWR